jgi:hypothetical protein
MPPFDIDLREDLRTRYLFMIDCQIRLCPTYRSVRAICAETPFPSYEASPLDTQLTIGRLLHQLNFTGSLGRRIMTLIKELWLASTKRALRCQVCLRPLYMERASVTPSRCDLRQTSLIKPWGLASETRARRLKIRRPGCSSSTRSTMISESLKCMLCDRLSHIANRRVILHP